MEKEFLSRKGDRSVEEVQNFLFSPIIQENYSDEPNILKTGMELFALIKGKESVPKFPKFQTTFPQFSKAWFTSSSGN